MSRSEGLPCFRTAFAVVWFQFCIFCGLLNFRFNWKTMRFQMLKRRKRVAKFILLNLTMVIAFLALIGTRNIFKSVFVYSVVVPYPVNFFYKQLFEQRRTIRHLNQLLRCIQDAQRLTGKQVVFTLPLCVALLSRLLSAFIFGTFLMFWVRGAGADSFRTIFVTLMMVVILQPFVVVYMHSHFVCCEVFCLRAVMLDLNDCLSEWIEDFNFYRQLKMLGIVKPKLRELARTYRRLARTLITFNSILGHDVVGLLLMLALAFVYFLNSRLDHDISAVFLLLFLYFSCLWDVVYGYTCYRGIRVELARTQALIEMVKVRPDRQIDWDMNCMLVVVDMVKLGLDVSTKRTEKVFCWVIGLVFLKLACHFGQRQYEEKMSSAGYEWLF